MNKIFKSCLASCVLANSLLAVSEVELENSYMLGAFHTLEQLQRNFKVQGINKDKIEFNKYIVALDVSTLPTYKLLIYQQIGYTESLTPIVVNDKYMVFNSYDRKADAIYLQEKILNSFHFKNKDEKAIIIENENPKGWFKSQFVQKELFDTLVAEVNKNVKAKVFVVEKDSLLIDKKLDTLEEMNKKENIPTKEPVIHKGAVKVENKPIVAVEKKPKNNTPTNLSKFKLKRLVTFNSYSRWQDDSILKRVKFVPIRNAKKTTSNEYRFATTKKDETGAEWVKLYYSNLWVKKNEIEIIN